AEARSFQLELVREHVKERRVRARRHRPGSAVHFDLEFVRHAHPPVVDQMRSVVIGFAARLSEPFDANKQQCCRGVVQFARWCLLGGVSGHSLPLVPARGTPRDSKSAFTRVCDALCVAGTPLRGPSFWLWIPAFAGMSGVCCAVRSILPLKPFARACGMPADWRSWFAPADRSD